MPDYLLCYLSPDGRVARTQYLICDDDQEAIERASQLTSEQVVELWAGNRMIKRFDPRIN